MRVPDPHRALLDRPIDAVLVTVMPDGQPQAGGVWLAVGPAEAAVGWDHHVGVWRPPATDPVAEFNVPVKGVYSLDLSPNGLLAAGCADNRVRIWALDKV